MTVGAFWTAVYDYCRILGGSVTSGPRSHQRNAAVGGVLDSPHVFGLGADVVYDVVPDEARRRRVGLRYGLLVLVEADHDHLQPLDWRA